MRRVRLKPGHALPALAGGLALLLAVELAWPQPGLPPALEVPVSAGHATDAGTDMVAQWAATSLARPVFAPGRRPAALAAAADSFTLPRLSAIIVIGQRPVAIFAASGQKPLVAAAGAMVGPYKLTAIHPQAVELAGPSGSLTLHLQPNPASAAKPNN